MYYITPVSLNSIPNLRRKKNNPIAEIVDEFVHSVNDAVEINWKVMGYKAVSTARNSFNNAVMRVAAPVKVIQRIDRLFLVKKGE